jgi:hypothetical protein
MLGKLGDFDFAIECKMYLYIKALKGPRTACKHGDNRCSKNSGCGHTLGARLRCKSHSYQDGSFIILTCVP